MQPEHHPDASHYMGYGGYGAFPTSNMYGHNTWYDTDVHNPYHNPYAPPYHHYQSMDPYGYHQPYGYAGMDHYYNYYGHNGSDVSSYQNEAINPKDEEWDVYWQKNSDEPVSEYWKPH